MQLPVPDHGPVAPLTEAERAATAGGDQGAAIARSRSRAMPKRETVNPRFPFPVPFPHRTPTLLYPTRCYALRRDVA